MTVQAELCSRTRATTSSSFDCDMPFVWESTTVFAYSIWFTKNSPKFLACILHFLASTTVVYELSTTSSLQTWLTALITSESLPTPDGSIKILSGLISFITFVRALSKSPTRVQQIQPADISVISMPASFKNPESTPMSPNSFSMRTTFSPAYASLMSFFIRVVLPAPRKPEKMSIFVIFFTPFT